MNRSISVYAPATVANMVCGFDVLGFALEKPADEFKVSLSDEAGVQIINLDDFNLPIIPSENVIAIAQFQRDLTSLDEYYVLNSTIDMFLNECMGSCLHEIADYIPTSCYYLSLTGFRAETCPRPIESSRVSF